MKRIFLPYLDTVRDQVRIGFEMDKKAGEEKVRLDPVDPKEEHIREKIRAFDHLFDLKKTLVRTAGRLLHGKDAVVPAQEPGDGGSAARRKWKRI